MHSTLSLVSSPNRTPPASSQTLKKCPTCSRAFSKPAHFARHLMTHTKDRPNICDHCGRSFARRDALERHARTVHGHSRSQATHPVFDAKQPVVPTSSQSSSNPDKAGRYVPKSPQNGSLSTGFDSDLLPGEVWPAAIIDAASSLYAPFPDLSSTSYGQSSYENDANAYAAFHDNARGMIEHSGITQTRPTSNIALTAKFHLDSTRCELASNAGPVPEDLDLVPSDVLEQLFTLFTNPDVSWNLPTSSSGQGADFSHDANLGYLLKPSGGKGNKPTVPIALDQPMFENPIHKSCTENVPGRSPWSNSERLSPGSRHSLDDMTTTLSPRDSSVTVDTHDRLSRTLEMDLAALTISGDDTVPPVAFVELTLELYWQHFHDQVPVLHRPTFESSQTAPLVILAMCAIGCMYVGTEEASRKGELLVNRLDQVLKLSVSESPKVYYIFLISHRDDRWRRSIRFAQTPPNSVPLSYRLPCSSAYASSLGRTMIISTRRVWPMEARQPSFTTSIRSRNWHKLNRSGRSI